MTVPYVPGWDENDNVGLANYLIDAINAESVQILVQAQTNLAAALATALSGSSGSGGSSGTKVSGSNSTAAATPTVVIAAPPSGKQLYITSVQCFRTDAGATPIIVTLNDSAATVIGLSGTGIGSGNDMVFETPLVVAAATALTFTPSSAASNVYLNAQGYYA